MLYFTLLWLFSTSHYQGSTSLYAMALLFYLNLLHCTKALLHSTMFLLHSTRALLHTMHLTLLHSTMVILHCRAFCVPGIINLRIDGVESESLMMALGDVAVSSGSACTSTSVEPSHVLMAMGLGEEAAHSSLRVSMGRFTTQEEVDYAAKRIIESARELRAIASL